MTRTAGEGIDLATVVASEFHELKNQLGHLALKLDEVAAEHPDAADALESPRLICRRTADRLVQILTLYKSDHHDLSLNVEAHSPAAFIEELTAEVRSLAGKRLQVESRLDGPPPFWFFDRYLAQTALLNAVHNALQYAKEHVIIGAKGEEGGLLLYVKDDSSGYPAHMLENQGRTPSESASGTGLGLFFSQTIAAAHENKGRHGNLRLANDGGAVFSLWLP